MPNLPRDAPQVAVGDPVPELALLYPDGTPVAIDNFIHPGRPLVIVFGSVVAGVVPGVIGGAAVAITLALMVVAGRFFELSIFSLNLATMLGLTTYAPLLSAIARLRISAR